MSFVQRDYLLRIIEQFAEVLNHVLHLRRGGSVLEARLYIEQHIGRLVGIEPEDVANRSAAELAAEIRSRLSRHQQPQLVSDQMVVLAGLLHESAHISDEAGEQPRALAERLKALDLYVEVLTVDEPVCAPAEAAVDVILEELPDLPSPATMRKLVDVFEAARRFDEAEDWLFHLIDSAPAHEQHLTDGIAFYERLLTLDDATLREGSLPVDEALAGLADLLERQAALPR